jgi:hypothetical protein
MREVISARRGPNLLKFSVNDIESFQKLNRLQKIRTNSPLKALRNYKLFANLTRDKSHNTMQITEQQKIDFVNAALKHIRVDGPIDAPIKFLTIEDGDGYSKADLKNYSLLLEKLANPGHKKNGAAPGEIEGLMHERASFLKALGKPGKFICKFMCVWNEKPMAGYQDYAKNTLYQREEANIKFYPLARSKQIKWESEGFHELTGLRSSEYLRACKAYRPYLFNKENVIKRSDKIIILGAESEWLAALGILFGDDINWAKQVQVSLTPAEKRPHIYYRLYFDHKSDLRIASLNCFSRGLVDIHIEQFANELKRNWTK